MRHVSSESTQTWVKMYCLVTITLMFDDHARIS